MAYKFQLGAAKLAGNLTTEDITTDTDGIISGSIGRFTHLSCSSDSLILGATTLSEAELGIVDGFAGVAENIAADHFVFRDADNGKLRYYAMANGIKNGMIADGAVNATDKLADGIVTSVKVGSDLVNANISNSANIAISKLAASTISGKSLGANLDNISAGAGLSGTAYNGSAAQSWTLDLSGSTMSLASGKLGISGSLAGPGLMYVGHKDSILGIEVDVETSKGLQIDGTSGRVKMNADNAFFAFSGAGALQLADDGVTGAKLHGDVAGAGIQQDGSGNLELKVDSSTVEIASDTLRVRDGGVTNAKLQNAAITIAGSSTALGSAISAGAIASAIDSEDMALTSLTSLEMKNDADYSILDIGGNTLTIGASNTKVRIAGDLEIAGVTTQVSSTELLVEDKTIRIGKGATNDAQCDEAGIQIGDGGAYGFQMLFDTSFNYYGHARVNVIKFQNGDGTAMKDVVANSFIGNFNQLISLKANGDTLALGVNVMNDMGSDGEDVLDLPAAPNVGDSVKVKAPSDCSAARYVTIRKNGGAGSHTVDGQASIRLESPHAAVELVYTSANTWKVF